MGEAAVLRRNGGSGDEQEEATTSHQKNNNNNKPSDSLFPQQRPQPLDIMVGPGSNEQEASSSRKENRQLHRHSPRQIQNLEAYFAECPHPDKIQREKLSRDLGLEPEQVKFWFQNKRYQKKAQSDREDNSALRAENNRIHCENVALRGSLKRLGCQLCKGPAFRAEDRIHNIQQLQVENAQLKGELQRVSAFLASYAATGRQSARISRVSQQQAHTQEENKLQGDPVMETRGSCFGPASDHFFSRNSRNNILSSSSSPAPSPHLLEVIQEREKSLMVTTARRAMNELVQLLQAGMNLWVKSPIDDDDNGSYVIRHDMLPIWTNRFRNLLTVRTEASRDSTVVPMPAVDLIKMFLDSKQWENLFPTIVTKARTIAVTQSRELHGPLQLIYAQMHALSPLVEPRQFLFVRYCQPLNPSSWLLVDVSYDCFKDVKEDPSSSPWWRFPSGCIIEDKGDGSSSVTWIEHMMVDDNKSVTHHLYRDLVHGCRAYGARRWIANLHRMSERIACSQGARTMPGHRLEEVISEGAERRSIMMLSHLMVKNFCRILSVADKLHSGEETMSISISRSNKEPGQIDNGIVVTAASSLWLPFSCETLFNFFRDARMRQQWDVLSTGAKATEIAHISLGTHPGNCISFIQPVSPYECKSLILQESCFDASGGLVVYSPIDLPAVNAAMHGQDPSVIPLVPSGFIVSGDGRFGQGTVVGPSSSSRARKAKGSVVTVAFRIVMHKNSVSAELRKESMATITNLMRTTVGRIKEALDCSNED